MADDVVVLETGDDQALAKLKQYTTAAEGAFARNTERALRADTTIFTAWCSSASLPALPAAPQTIASFVEAMRVAGKRPATIRRYLSSVSHMHRAAELGNPVDSNPAQLALRRMLMEDGADQRQADGITRRLVDRLLHAGGSSLRDVRNRALLAVAYDTLCRRSELVALMREDIQILDHGDGTVLVRRGKTDQAGAGMARYLARDTVALVRHWLDAAGIGTSGLLFRAVLKGNRLGEALHPAEVSRVFKGMARAAGFSGDEVSRISAHSSRVGAAQDMAASDRIEMPAIMQAGGWKSPQMVARYTRRQAARRSGAAKLAELQNRT